jgi:hypothetical protein
METIKLLVIDRVERGQIRVRTFFKSIAAVKILHLVVAIWCSNDSQFFTPCTTKLSPLGYLAAKTFPHH